MSLCPPEGIKGFDAGLKSEYYKFEWLGEEVKRPGKQPRHFLPSASAIACSAKGSMTA